MTRRVEISSDREVAALRSIRNVLANARPASRLLHLRPRFRGRGLEALAGRINRKSAPTAIKALGFAYLAALEARFGPVPTDGAPAALGVDALVFDRSALLALSRGNAAVRRHFERALIANARVMAPATVLLDARTFEVARDVAAIVEIVAIDATIALAAAALLVRARLDLPFEALTVACAPATGSVAIVTTDPAGTGSFVRVVERAGMELWPVAR